MTLDLSLLTQPLATLIAGIVGLGAIAYQTRRGFQNLIRSQEHRAGIERDARMHLFELERIKIDDAEKRKELKIAAALQGELESLAPRFYSLGDNFTQTAARAARDKAQHIAFREHALSVKKTDTPIFDEIVGDIGHLKSSIVKDVSFVYSKAFHAIEFKGIATHDAATDIYSSASTFYSQLGDECVQLAERLRCVVDGVDDPGPVSIKYDISEYLSEKKSRSAAPLGAPPKHL